MLVRRACRGQDCERRFRLLLKELIDLAGSGKEEGNGRLMTDKSTPGRIRGELHDR
ncbi:MULTISPECIES: hypothetical protein [Paenibacillus]|uniref:hypothetical protein n=1 Tax=Paenibacillus TaxID=44249 RepID=UPI00201E2635|nr:MULTISPECIES: hypothetical protein [Paenibacillus]